MLLTKKMFLALLALALPIAVWAQATPEPDIATSNPGAIPPPPEPGSATGNFACIEYLQPTSFQVVLTPNAQEIKSGETMTFNGVVRNSNPFPATDGIIQAKIFRKDADSSVEDGDALVDQFIVVKDFAIKAYSEKSLQFSWVVPPSSADGYYYAIASFSMAGEFTLSGSPITDIATGDYTGFKVNSGNSAPRLFIDKKSTTLNGQDVQLAGTLSSFPASEAVTVKTNVVNQSAEAKKVLLMWNEYEENSLLPHHQRNRIVETLNLEPGQTKEVAYTLSPAAVATSYLEVTLAEGDTKSILNVAVARTGAGATRLSLAGVLGLPIKKGVTLEPFGCAQSNTGAVAAGGLLTLTLRDTDGQEIHTARMVADAPAEVAGWKDVFTPENDYNNFTLTATLEQEGVVIKDVTLHYDCSALGTCTGEEESVSEIKNLWQKIFQIGWKVAVAGGVILIAILIALNIRKRKQYF